MGEPARCLEAHDGQDALRIFDARQSGGTLGVSAGWTVTALWHGYYKPVHLVAADARPRNIEEIQQSVEYWARATTKAGVEPPIDEVSVFHCADFVAFLKTLPGRKSATMGNNTIRKHCAAIQAMFDLCGQPDRKYRNALGLLDRVPYITRPRKQKKEAEDCFTIDEIELLLDNADAAQLPVHLPCSPGTYFRRLYVWTFNTGLRIGGTMGAKWRHFHGDHLVLEARVAAKGHDDFRAEVNEAAQQVAQLMLGYDAERIFPWPTWPCSSSNLYREHRKIAECLPKHRRFAFHGVRKLTNNELARINPKACEKVLGHKQGSTNVESYTSRVVAAEALSRLPTLSLTRDQQGKLFDF